MKVAEILTEAPRALKERVGLRLLNDLEAMAHDYRVNMSELAGTTFEETPIPCVSTIVPVGAQHDPTICVMRNRNISDSIWYEIRDVILEHLKEEGYVDGILPVDVVVIGFNHDALNLQVQ